MNVKSLGNLRNPFVEILHRLLEYLVSTGSRAFVRLSDMNSFFDKITVFKLWKCFYNSVVLLWALLQASDGRSSLFAQRSSVKKVFLKISQNSHKTPMPKSLFLIMFHASMCHFPKKKDSGAGVFLWILGNIWRHLFHRTSPVAAFVSV